MGDVTLKFCDKCGMGGLPQKEYETFDGITIVYHRDSKDFAKGVEDTYVRDLCKSCEQKFKAMIEAWFEGRVLPGVLSYHPPQPPMPPPY